MKKFEQMKYYYKTSPKLQLLYHVMLLVAGLTVGSAIGESCRKPRERIQLPTDVPAWQDGR